MASISSLPVLNAVFRFYTLRDGERFVKNVFRGGGRIAGISLRYRALFGDGIDFRTEGLRVARRLPAIQPGLGPRTPVVGTELGAQDLFKGRHFEKVFDFEIFFKRDILTLFRPVCVVFSRVGSGLTSAGSRMQQVTKTGRD